MNNLRISDGRRAKGSNGTTTTVCLSREPSPRQCDCGPFAAAASSVRNTAANRLSTPSFA
jgi:hypothetical protein